MEIPESADRRMEWFQRQAGGELDYWIESSLAEFQSGVEGISVESGVDVADIWIGGSFVDDDTKKPSDLDIGVVTDGIPASAVKDGFWRYVTDAQVLSIPLNVDCVWTYGIEEVTSVVHDTRQYSVRNAGVVSLADYPQSATGEQQQ